MISRKLEDYYNILDLPGSYQKVSYDDYRDLEDNAIRIDDNIFKIVSDRTDNYWGVVWAPVSDSDYRNSQRSAIVIEDHNGQYYNNYLTIFQVEDDWFYVSFSSGTGFKCDEAEGLYKFLSRINIFEPLDVISRRKLDQEKKKLLSDVTKHIMTFSDFNDIKNVRDKLKI
jgi:hypothetical protein